MSWEETLQQVVRKYYRAGAADPPAWVTSTAGNVSEPVTLANATCGDRVIVHVDPTASAPDQPGRIWLDVAGCAICKASAEMAARAGTVLSPGDLELLAQEMLAGIEGSPGSEGADRVVTVVPTAAVPPDDIETMLKLREVPGRSRCASLPWEAVLRALESSR